MKWLDLSKFLNIFIEQIKKDYIEISKIKYFTANVKQKYKDDLSPKNQQTYLKALETLNDFEIIMGTFKEVTPTGIIKEDTKEKPKMVTICKMEEKESDVNIGIHIINDCHKEKENLAGIILVSSDTDLSPVLRMMEIEFPHLKRILLYNNKKGSMSLKEKSTSKYQIKLKYLINSLFPDVIHTKNNPIKKPEEWV